MYSKIFVVWYWHMDNPWNTLSEYFDTHRQGNQIPSGAADNMLLAWPPMLQLIDSYVPQKNEKRALDFGCGAGSFCKALHSFGFTVTGIDNAPKMIELARQHTDPAITYEVGDTALLETLQPFAVITSVMVFQFIEPIEDTLQKITQVLESQGLLVFAVFNPAWVSLCLKASTLFYQFDSVEAPTRGIIRFGEHTEIPTFVRTAADYDALLTPLGYQKILEEYPPFTKKFLAKYPTDTPTSVSEYLILGYRRLA